MLGLCSTACICCMLHLRSEAVRHSNWIVSSVFCAQQANPVMEAQGAAWLASQSVFIWMAFYYIRDVSPPDVKYKTQTPSVLSKLQMTGWGKWGRIDIYKQTQELKIMKHPPKHTHTHIEDAWIQIHAEIKMMLFKTNYLNVVLMAHSQPDPLCFRKNSNILYIFF